MVLLSESEKLILLRLIFEKKAILFGSYSSTITKTECWTSILNKCVIEYGFSPTEKDGDYKYLRDVVWPNLKKCTTAKVQNNSKTGGSPSKYTRVDDMVLEIIGKESAVIKGISNQKELDPARKSHTTTTIVQNSSSNGDQSDQSQTPPPLISEDIISTPVQMIISDQPSTSADDGIVWNDVMMPSISAAKKRKRPAMNNPADSKMISLTDIDHLKKRKLELDIEERELQIEKLRNAFSLIDIEIAASIIR